MRACLEKMHELPYRFTSWEIARGLRRFWESEHLNERLRQVAKGGMRLALDMCSTARSFIINQCPNLRYITTDRIDCMFPFVVSTTARGAIPLAGLGSPFLTELSMGQGIMNGKATSSCQNSVWLIVFLPHVITFELYGYLDEGGVKFLQEHSGVSEPKSNSKLKDLKLTLEVRIPNKPGDTKITNSYRNLSSFTSQLERLYLSFVADDVVSSEIEPPEQSILMHLDSSTLTKLGLNSINFRWEDGSNSLSCLDEVEELSVDEMFIMNYRNRIENSQGPSLTNFSPNLKTLP